MQNTTKRAALVIVGVGVLALAFALAAPPQAEARNGTLVRPISDFLDAQTHPSVSNIYWVGNDTGQDPSLAARVDWVGTINKGYLVPRGIDLGTAFSGQVTERVLTDGRTEVHVVLHGENVLFFTWLPGVGWTSGYSAPLIVQGAEADTCSVHYDLTYVTTNEPGDPLTDLGDLLFDTPEGWEILQSRLQAHGDCVLRAAFGVDEGTPGRFSMNMTALIHPKGGDVTQDDTYPVGNIRLRVVGN